MSVATPAPHPAFLALLPVIEAHARSCFRRLRCPHDRDDAVADAVALAWERFAAGRAGDGGCLARDAVAAVRRKLAPAPG